MDANIENSEKSKGFIGKDGGCGRDNTHVFWPVRDRNGKQEYRWMPRETEYEQLLGAGSIGRFWVCGACSFPIFAGMKIDAEVDSENRRPNCGADVNASLANHSNDSPTGAACLRDPCSLFATSECPRCPARVTLRNK